MIRAEKIRRPRFKFVEYTLFKEGIMDEKVTKIVASAEIHRTERLRTLKKVPFVSLRLPKCVEPGQSDCRRLMSFLPTAAGLKVFYSQGVTVWKRSVPEY